MAKHNHDLNKILAHISLLKEKECFQIIDTHVHPFDVMGVINYQDYNKNNQKIFTQKQISGANKKSFPKRSILEIFRYNKNLNLLLPVYFKIFSASVKKIIEASFQDVCEEKILYEMSASLVDQAVLIPIEPLVTASKIYENFSNKSFLLLGSVDIHNLSIKQIRDNLHYYIYTNKIVGIKFHPNIQNFMPQPKGNPPYIAEKLRLIYSMASENNLYLLFHGGLTNFVGHTGGVHATWVRKNNNALLENFCDKYGISEILDTYTAPVIIAHLGHQGLVKINYYLIKKLADRYGNIFFDTSGVSPAMIKNVIKITTSKRILFGSDALYYSMLYNLLFVYYAINNVKSDERFEEMFINIVGRNFHLSILKKPF